MNDIMLRIHRINVHIFLCDVFCNYTLLILLYNLRKENEYNIAKSINFEHIDKVNIF